MSITENPIRIGQINFTNVWPIFYYFPIRELQDQVECIIQVPTQLNQAMSLGTIDMAPISSFAYGANFEHYLLYPDLSVSAYGKVNSILLFHKKPVEDILFGSIALPTTSATSINLLKIIIEKFYQGNPSYHYAQPFLDQMMQGADAALLIGDDAIKARWNFPDYEVMDLGEQWGSLTGHWMSFAVWAIRKEIVETRSNLVEEIYSAFQEGKRLGLKHPEAIIHKAQSNVGGTYEFWEQYFSQLKHDFGPEQRAGLQLYFQYALELGLVSKEVPIQLWNKKRVAQVKE